MIVVDATVLADFFVGTEARREAALRLLDEDSEWISPSLWRYELGNVLRNCVKSKTMLLPESTALMYLNGAESLVMETNEITRGKEVFEIAIERGLTMYDASYVWLAKNRSLKLRTRDAEVLRNCPEVAMPMPFVEDSTVS